jgi:hypothetical protein
VKVEYHSGVPNTARNRRLVVTETNDLGRGSSCFLQLALSACHSWAGRHPAAAVDTRGERPPARRSCPRSPHRTAAAFVLSEARPGSCRDECGRQLDPARRAVGRACAHGPDSRRCLGEARAAGSSISAQASEYPAPHDRDVAVPMVAVVLARPSHRGIGIALPRRRATAQSRGCRNIGVVCRV